MTVYHWLIVLLLLSAFLMHGEKKHNYKFIWTAVLLLFCVYGLRDAYTVGNDTTSYRLHFERMAETEWKDLPSLNSWFEVTEGEEEVRHANNIAFEWLLKIGYEWTDGNYQLFVTAVSAFVMLVFVHFLKRYSVSPIQSILVYLGLLLYTFNFSSLKQSIAMAFILLSMDSIMDRKLLRFLILVAVASMFHFPALVFLPAYWIGNMKIGRTYVLFLAILFFLTYFFRDQILEWMTDVYDTQLDDHGKRFLANKVLIMLVIIAAALVIRPPVGKDRIYNATLMMVGVAAVIQTFANYNNTFERLADYYFQFAVIFIPMVFENVKLPKRHLNERQLKMVCAVGPYLFCAFAIWRFLDYVQSPGAWLTPYHFCFEADKAVEELLYWRVL